MLKDVNTEKLSIEIAGENALIIYFSDCVNDETTAKVKQAEYIIRQAMQAELALDIIDLIPSYASILVVFNMLNTDHHHVRNKLRVLLHSVTNNLDINDEQANQIVVELPVYYSEESGPDLTVIAKRNR